VEIYTIGFTQKTAEEFFERLRRAAVRRLIDIRLQNTSQLAGFAKRGDLAYFLRELCGAEYHHEPALAPTPELLRAYAKQHLPWEEYAAGYRRLLEEREVEKILDRRLFDAPTVLLCSEPAAEHCHRRLAAEYLAEHWEEVEIVHL
jgi:uncharacterized protein (DUF488 family)